jgi:hypothetical protein
MTKPQPEPTHPELAKQLASFLETGRKAAAENPPPPESRPTAQIIQLPFWPDPVRGAPNPLLRSALFAAIHSKKRRQLGIITRPEKPPQAIMVAAQNGDTIKYAGTQLNQYDADVFWEALHRAHYHPLETECIFTGYAFLKVIGRQDGPREYEDLEDSLTRLRDGRVEIYWKINGRHYKFVGGLISSYVREKNSKLYKVTFAKEIRELFAPSCWTQLEWQERMALKGKHLAQWLHGHYSSHAPRFAVSVAFLHEKSGSTRPLLKHFKEDLKNALKDLHEILGWNAEWDGDLVTVRRPPSPSQARYLAKNRETRKRKRQPKRGEKGLAPIGDLLPGLLKS